MSTGSMGKIGAADAGDAAMNWLLPFVPVTIAQEYLAPERYLLIFFGVALKDGGCPWANASHF